MDKVNKKISVLYFLKLIQLQKKMQNKQKSSNFIIYLYITYINYIFNLGFFYIDKGKCTLLFKELRGNTKIFNNKQIVRNNNIFSNYSYKNFILLLSLKQDFFIKDNQINFYYSMLNDLFIKKFVEIFFLKKVYIKYVTYDLFINKDQKIYIEFFRRLQKVYIFSKSFLLLNEVIEILIYTLYSKDINLLNNWIKATVEKLHYKTHRKFFYLFKVILDKFFILYFKYFGCLGFYMRVKGKIGLGGNSKKKRSIIKYGNFSFVSKNLKLVYKQDVLRTSSGVLGIELYLTYF